jgi:hypothetical protein
MLQATKDVSIELKTVRRSRARAACVGVSVGSTLRSRDWSYFDSFDGTFLDSGSGDRWAPGLHTGSGLPH